MPKLKIDELNKIYDSAEEVDKEVFAEMRSNVLMIAGEHYNKKLQSSLYRLRGIQDMNEPQKLRLIKNHVYKIVRHYENSILSYAPDVTIRPQRDTEIQDQKAAELNQAVKEDAKHRYRLREKVREWVSDFVGVGEVAVKITYNKNGGDLIGYEEKLGPEGMPELSDTGEPQKDEDRPIFSGAFEFETIFAANLLRDPSAKKISDSKYLIVRKMVDKKLLENMFPEAKAKESSGQGKTDFVVFDSDKNQYERLKDQVLVREFYYRPSFEYPHGYFYFVTEEKILAEGELPFGKFPIVWAGFDKFTTAARARSIVKVIRPYQAEINRASSQLAMTQITVGDDKIIYSAGAKLAPGSLLPGVRGISYQGGLPPTVLPGRDGSQFLPYISAQISEMYSAAMLDEINMEKDTQMDPYGMLFRSLKDQQKFSQYSESFEQFLIDTYSLYLDLARKYLPDDYVVMAVGARERINIAEFRTTSPLSYSIIVEPQAETVETKLGRQLTLNQVLQYAGQQLTREDVGKVIRAMPYANAEEAFGDITLDYDNVKNDMLAMERGERPLITEFDNHEYIVGRLTARIKQQDFRYLAPEIQDIYMEKLEAHRQYIQQQQEAAIALKNEFIPVSGALIACDMYIPNPDDPTKPAKRVRVPYQALDWLIQKLEAQGLDLEKLETMNQGIVSQLSQQIIKGGAPSQAETAPPPQTSAIGVS